MAKNKPFHTIAEAIEAGEPPIADKITGELDIEKVRFFSVENYDKSYHVERVFNTLSGGFVIIARPRTPAEMTAREKASLILAKKEKEAENDRIKKALFLSGYILIGWRFSGQGAKVLTERGNAYYMPISGARYVFSKCITTVWKKDERECGYITAEPEKRYNGKIRDYEEFGMSRRARKELAADIKQKPDEYFLAAPIWLLTSIPDPRPRYLHPENEGEGEIAAAGV